MSEPMSSHQIEDVLSSIRRLVSDDLRPRSRVAPVPELVDKLLLTPALRVVAPPSAPDQPDAMGPAAAVATDDGIAASRMAEAVAAWHEDDTFEDDAADGSAIAFLDMRPTAPTAGDIGGIVAAFGSGIAAPDAHRDAAPDASIDRHRDIAAAHGDAAAQPIPTTQAVSKPIVGTPDDAEGAPVPVAVDPVGPSSAVGVGMIDGVMTGVAPSDAMTSGGIDTSDSHPLPKTEPVDAADVTAAPQDSRPVVFRSRRDAAVVPGDGRDLVEVSEVSADSAVVADEPDVMTAAAEDMVSIDAIDDQAVVLSLDPDGVDHADAPPIDLAPVSDVTGDLAATVIEAEMADLHSEADSYAAPASADTAEIVAHGDGIEDAVLMEIVRTMIHAELKGALGERITRNVRKLVRAEIQRVLATRDLD